MTINCSPHPGYDAKGPSDRPRHDVKSWPSLECPNIVHDSRPITTELSILLLSESLTHAAASDESVGESHISAMAIENKPHT